MTTPADNVGANVGLF